MIVDEKEIGQRFLIDLLRMEGQSDLLSAAQGKAAQSFNGSIDDILLELELSDPEINEDMNEPGLFVEVVDSPQEGHEPLVAITRQHLSDSRKNWNISKVIIGTRKCYSA